MPPPTPGHRNAHLTIAGISQDPALAPAADQADITASLLAPPTLPAPVPAKPAAHPAMPAIQPPLNINQAAQNGLPVTAIPAVERAAS